MLERFTEGLLVFIMLITPILEAIKTSISANRAFIEIKTMLDSCFIYAKAFISRWSSNTNDNACTYSRLFTSCIQFCNIFLDSYTKLTDIVSKIHKMINVLSQDYAKNITMLYPASHAQDSVLPLALHKRIASPTLTRHNKRPG